MSNLPDKAPAESERTGQDGTLLAAHSRRKVENDDHDLAEDSMRESIEVTEKSQLSSTCARVFE
jgi:hypothetical protein